MFLAHSFHVGRDGLLFGFVVLYGKGFIAMNPPRRFFDPLPCALALDHRDGLQKHALFDDLRFEVVTFLDIQRPPQFRGERELRPRRTRMSAISRSPLSFHIFYETRVS